MMAMLHRTACARRRRGVAALLAVGTLGTACAGPHVAMQLGLRSYPTSVQFGSVKSLALAPPVPPGGLTVAPPPVLAQVGQPFTPMTGGANPVPAGRPASACPAPGPFAIPLLATTDTVASPPAPATYAFRNTGQYTSGNSKGVYPATAAWVVQKVTKTGSGSFSFEIVSTSGPTVTTTGFNYQPPSAAGQTTVGSTPVAGLYLTSMVQKSHGRTVTDFHPAAPGFLLLEVPAVAGDQWNSTATDPNSKAEMTGTLKEGATKEVAACGQVLDALPVQVDGRIGVSTSAAEQPVSESPPSPVPTPAGAQYEAPASNTAVTFTATYWFATQYGGLPVQTTERLSGTMNGVTTTSVETSTIDVVPKA
jgi:hypothetical protein